MEYFRAPIFLIGILLCLTSICPGCHQNRKEQFTGQPNILFCISDDQSWEHLSCYGDRAVETPNIDHLAVKGIRFINAYCAAPSCSPSRAAILTGQDIWRLEEGGVLWGFLRSKYPSDPYKWFNVKKTKEKSGYSLDNFNEMNYLLLPYSNV